MSGTVSRTDYAGDARDDVGEALEMLHVDRGPDVDARVEQLLDVLPAFGMPALGRVGVGEFVDDDELGPALQRAVESNSSIFRPCHSTLRRGRISSPRVNASVSARPCVSTRPMTTSTPSCLSTRARCSIA